MFHVRNNDTSVFVRPYKTYLLYGSVLIILTGFIGYMQTRSTASTRNTLERTVKRWHLFSFARLRVRVYVVTRTECRMSRCLGSRSSFRVCSGDALILVSLFCSSANRACFVA